MKATKALLILSIALLPLSFCAAVEKTGLLKVAFLDVGQGDSIYIQAPNGAQMIIDGGPAGSLATPLGAVMPFGDRSINVIMVTNPDTDHYAGFLDVIRTYDIGAVIEPGTVTKTPTHATFQKEIADRQIPELLARKGMTIDIDKEHGVTFTVLFPDRDVSTWTTNDGSLEGILTYGKTKVMFTGDGSKKTESFVVAGNTPETLKSDILKVAHHGSATSSSEALVSAVAPTWAIISAGYHNSYGLPKQVTLDMLLKHNVTTLRTDDLGTIIFTSDGNTFTQQK